MFWNVELTKTWEWRLKTYLSSIDFNDKTLIYHLNGSGGVTNYNFPYNNDLQDWARQRVLWLSIGARDWVLGCILCRRAFESVTFLD